MMAKILIVFALFCNFILLSLGDVVGQGVGHHRQTVQVSKDYWTPERMRNAIPLDLVHSDDVEEATSRADESSVNAFSEAVFGEGKDSIVFSSEPYNGTENENKKRAYPFPYSAGYAPSYTDYPWRTIGKVFFVKGGLNYVCSGSAIGQFAVATAGHCVYDAEGGTGWVSNFVFVPGYNNGNAPFGVWYSYTLYTTSDWAYSVSNCRDFGFSVMTRDASGYGVGDYVGYLGWTYNAGTNQNWRSLGYPAGAPFNGETMYYTDSGFGATASVNGCSPAMIGIGSDATGGCSGGPWIIGFGSSNWLNGINTWKFNAQPGAIYGPYFDNAWYSLYANAVSVVP